MTTKQEGFTLKLYFLNSGIGESIVVGMPNGKWGVIDCYASKLSESNLNPTLNLLKYLKVIELEFIALTHPHCDHYRGMSTLIAEYSGKIKFFWRFDSFDLKVLNWYLKEKTKFGFKQDQRNIKEIHKIFMLVRQERQKYGLKRKRMSDFKSLYNDGSIKIEALGPSHDILEEFEDGIKIARDGNNLYLKKKNTGNENRLSAIMNIMYGECCYVFFADSDNIAQTELFNDITNTNRKFNTKLVKISHHGSINGHHEDLLNILLKDKSLNPYSVVTPFISRGLPKLDVLNYFQKNTKLFNTYNYIEYLNDNERKSIFDSILSTFSKSISRIPGENCGIVYLEFDEYGNVIEENETNLRDFFQ